MHSRRIRTVWSVLLVSVLAATGAAADTITFSLGLGNTAIAGYPGPYGSVEVDRTSSTSAVITFTSGSVGGYTYLFGDGGTVAINVNATSWTLGAIVGTNGGTGFTPGPLGDGGSGTEDGFGSFNQKIDSFDGYTHSEDFVQLSITNTSGSWASAADVLAPNASGYQAAAHIFVCSGDGACDASAGALATGFATVPEASTLVSIGLGLAALGSVRRRSG